MDRERGRGRSRGGSADGRTVVASPTSVGMFATRRRKGRRPRGCGLRLAYRSSLARYDAQQQGSGLFAPGSFEGSGDRAAYSIDGCLTACLRVVARDSDGVFVGGLVVSPASYRLIYMFMRGIPWGEGVEVEANRQLD